MLLAGRLAIGLRAGLIAAGGIVLLRAVVRLAGGAMLLRARVGGLLLCAGDITAHGRGSDAELCLAAQASERERQPWSPRVAQVDHGVVAHLDPADLAAVDKDAVEAALVLGDPFTVNEPDYQVDTRHQRVCDAYIGVDIAADMNIVPGGELSLVTVEYHRESGCFPTSHRYRLYRFTATGQSSRAGAHRLQTRVVRSCAASIGDRKTLAPVRRVLEFVGDRDRIILGRDALPCRGVACDAV
ncbi:Uncharacterised protein [Mycobacteroides abscessus]|nr:Uncharacterised protein [Mycobacteroides abscessus]